MEREEDTRKRSKNKLGTGYLQPQTKVMVRFEESEHLEHNMSLNHIWTLFSSLGSIWVAWFKAYPLKRISVWQVNVPQVLSEVEGKSSALGIWLSLLLLLTVMPQLLVLGGL